MPFFLLFRPCLIILFGDRSLLLICGFLSRILVFSKNVSILTVVPLKCFSILWMLSVLSWYNTFGEWKGLVPIRWTFSSPSPIKKKNTLNVSFLRLLKYGHLHRMWWAVYFLVWITVLHYFCTVFTVFIISWISSGHVIVKVIMIR